MRLNRMAKADVVDDAIAVSATDTFTLDEPPFFQILNDPLNGPLRDADLHGHFTQHRGLVLVKQDKDMRVIRQKGPPLPTSGLFHDRLASPLTVACDLRLRVRICRSSTASRFSG